MKQPQSSASKTLHYHPTNHNDVIRFAGLLTPLQMGYWLIIRCQAYAGGCRPLPPPKIARILRITEDDPDLLEVLHGDYGFEETGEGWIVPELVEQHAKATQRVHALRERGSRGGTQRAVKAGQAIRTHDPSHSAVPLQDDPYDF